MNIHEHQAKEILKEFGAPVPYGVVIFGIYEIKNKIKKFQSNNFVLKAQIHAGGRGKAGGIKLVKNIEELKKESEKMLGKELKTNQTGKYGKKVKRLYIEETCNIAKEFYLSCLVDRKSSKRRPANQKIRGHSALYFICFFSGCNDIFLTPPGHTPIVLTIIIISEISVNKLKNTIPGLGPWEEGSWLGRRAPEGFAIRRGDFSHLQAGV